MLTALAEKMDCGLAASIRQAVGATEVEAPANIG
jgi:hypothetical protein